MVPPPSPKRKWAIVEYLGKWGTILDCATLECRLRGNSTFTYWFQPKGNLHHLRCAEQSFMRTPMSGIFLAIGDVITTLQS
jgi:hypothetical protein